MCGIVFVELGDEAIEIALECMGEGQQEAERHGIDAD
jgi:hypothetical protein